MTQETWEFLLFVIAGSRSSSVAASTLRRLCEQRLCPDCWVITEVDLLVAPAMALEHRVLAIPTVVRVKPAPTIRLIGDLSDELLAVQVLRFPPVEKT